MSEKSSESPVYDFQVVRQLRKREALTLAQLAEKSGTSVAVLSKLERNQSAAELETISKVARVFSLTASDLIALAESPLAHHKKADSYHSDSFFFHRIRYGNHHCFLGEAPQGAEVSRPDVHGDDLETCWVIQGHLRLKIGIQTIELRSGESVQFDAVQDHTYEALADSIFFILHLKKTNRF
ncbi:MAG: XRE family transcriptional regulator [Verrucomicrobiota bacterium]